jgi:dipeptidyl aminopeptidase/acylaminoacyl peptidase
MRRGLGTAAMALLGVAAAQAAPAQPRLTPEIYSRDWDEWVGMAPQSVRWSPDGKSLYFVWNKDHAAVPSLYVVDPAGGAPRKVTPEQALSVPPAASRRPSTAPAATSATRDGRRQVWERDGDVFLLDVASGKVTRLTNTESAEQDPNFTFDQEEVTWSSGGNLFSYSLATGAVTQLTRFRAGSATDAAGPTEYERYLAKRQLEIFETLRNQGTLTKAQQADRDAELGARPAGVTLKASEQIQDLVLSPDERTVTFIRADSSKVEAAAAVIETPRFITSRGFNDLQKNVTGRVSDPLREYTLGVMDLAKGTVRYVDSSALGKPVSWNAVLWSPDGKRALAWVGSRDHKDLWLMAVDAAAATARPIYHETDEFWLRGFRAGRYLGEDGAITSFLPDGSGVGFVSERDGWYHLYTVPVDGGEAKQLTKGAFEVTRPTISKDGKSWIFLSSEGDPGQVHLYTMPLEGGPRTRLTSGEGWNASYQVSPDGSQVALIASNPIAPEELFVLPVRPGATARALTQSTSAEFRAHRWQRPEFVTFPDPSGFVVHASVLRPERPHPSKPAIIYIHGAGWTQGVSKKFDPYFELNRAQFQFYADQGYTVMAVDYKASRGYGRDSRVSVYKKVGEPEVVSLVAAADYLVKTHGVDRRRIGIYGHSYGGFLVNYALFTRPGVFAGGVSEAGQADYAQQGTSAFLTRILGGFPMQDPEAYQRASPIQFAENFKDRLLMLHGALDATVPLQQPFMLAQRLMELKKTGWDIAVYPMEGHVPHLESSVLDMERRRFAFFESVLKGPRPASVTARSERAAQP